MPIRKIPERIIEVPYSDNMITEIDQWLLTSDQSISNDQILATSSFQRMSDDGFVHKGIGLSYDTITGMFSFPSTGYYKISSTHLVDPANVSAECYIMFQNNGALSSIANAYANVQDRSSSIIVDCVLRVATTTNTGFYFRYFTNIGNNMLLKGQSGFLRTGFNCIKIGEI